MVTAFAIRRLAHRASIDPTRIILSGVALGAALSAWVGFIVFAADRAAVPPIEFWLLGSLAGSTWRAFGTVIVFVAIAAGIVWFVPQITDSPRPPVFIYSGRQAAKAARASNATAAAVHVIVSNGSTPCKRP